MPAVGDRVKDVAPQQSAAPAGRGVDHDPSGHHIVGGQRGAGETHLVIAVQDHGDRAQGHVQPDGLCLALTGGPGTLDGA